MLLLHGVPFGHAWAASGVRNFDGRGYPYHKKFPWKLANLTGSVFVTKTVLIDERAGNLPLEADGCTPKEKRPKCIYVDPWTADVGNAVGLSNRGAEFYLATAGWTERTEPFVISFMAMGDDLASIIDEAQRFADLMKKWLPLFKTQIAIQVNVSCPNVEHAKIDKLAEIRNVIGILAMLGVPIIPKFNPLADPAFVAMVSRIPGVAAVSVSNTIPWADFSESVKNTFFHKDVSPLAQFNGGGWSGQRAFPFVVRWFERAKSETFDVPILGGCGVTSWRRAKRLIDLGASGIEFGSVVITSPWSVPGLIRSINDHFAEKDA